MLRVFAILVWVLWCLPVQAQMLLRGAGPGSAGGCSGASCITFTVTGPSTGTAGVASTNFTVTLGTGSFNGSQTITIADGVQGGTITPSVGSPGTSTVVVTPANLATSFTFTYTATVGGPVSLSFTNAQGWSNAGSKSYTGAVTYTASGPSTGTTGSPSTSFTVSMPGGVHFTGSQTVTIADASNGGTFTPSVGSPGTSTVTVTPAAAATSFTFTYTAATDGAKTLTFTNAQSWTNPSPLTYTASTAAGATLNPANASTNLTLSNGNLTITTTGGTNYQAAQSTASHTTGQFYFEVTYVTSQGASQVAMGMTNSSFVAFTDIAGLGFDGNASIAAYQSASGWYEGSVPSGATPAIVVGHTYGVAVDLGAHKIWLRDTAAPATWNAGSSADPATGVGAVASVAMASCPCFAAVMGYHTAGNVLTVNFGGTGYGAAAPSGYGNW